MDEAVNGVGDRYTVDHHDREHREPVNQGDQNTDIFTEEARDHFQDVLTLLRGSAEHARVGAVRQECHGADHECGHQQRPEAETTGVNRQEKDTGAYCGAE